MIKRKLFREIGVMELGYLMCFESEFCGDIVLVTEGYRGVLGISFIYRVSLSDVLFRFFFFEWFGDSDFIFWGLGFF